MVTTSGKMMVKNLVNYADPMGLEQGWHSDSSMEFQQVTIGEQGQMYALVDKEIYIRNGRTDIDAVGSDWQKFHHSNQMWKHIDAGNRELWAINVYHEVYRG